MYKVTLAFVAAIGVLLSACGSKTEADFSIVPVKGSGGDYQYIDIAQKGKIVINPQFGQAGIFRDGLALVKTSGRDGKWGYIDKNGKFAIAPIYSVAQDFSEGTAWVQMEDQPPMLIDKKGKMILQIDSLTKAYPFNEGAARIDVYTNGQEISMFIDKKGKPAATIVGGELEDTFIIDGLYVFKNAETKKLGYKNKKGETVIKEQFDEVNAFIDGMATVKSGDKYGAINKKGEYIINPQYDELNYDSDGLFVAKVGKKSGWVNKKGEITINPQFDDLFPFCGNQLAPVQMGSKFAYVNKSGQIIINPQFKGAVPFNSGYAAVLNDDGKVGFINSKGEYVVYPMYDIDLGDVFEYLGASIQNAYGFPAQYTINFYQDGKFKPYERLKEKRKAFAEAEVARKAEEKAKAAEEAAAKAAAIAEEIREAREMGVAEGEILKDSRDGKEYKTVRIGKQIWLAGNLNYEAEGSVCYDNKPENCEKYGRLYNWVAAVKICPSGWHLPSKDEWETLANIVGSNAGKKLKSKNGWNGTDEYGFSALPGGLNASGKFSGAGSIGLWWSATEHDASNALRYIMDSSHGNMEKLQNDKTRLLSVRCVKN